MKVMKIIYLIVLLTLFCNLHAQEKTITGIVTDFKGKHLAGVNILVNEYPSIITISGADGKYQINVPIESKKLLFTFTGTKNKEVEIKNENNINVELDYLPGKNPDPWSLTAYTQIGETNIFNPSKFQDTSWSCSGAPSFFMAIEIEYFFSQKFGISTGIGLNKYISKSWLDDFNNFGINSVQKSDKDNDSYYLYNEVSDLEEKTELTAISLPIALKCRLNPGKKWDFFVYAGIKLLFVRDLRVFANGSSKWQGYYPQYHIVLYDLPDYGFTAYTINTSNSVEKYNNFLVSVNGFAGVSRRLSKKMNIDLGIFYERGISDIACNEPVHEADFLNTVGKVDKTYVKGIGMMAGIRYYFVNLK